MNQKALQVCVRHKLGVALDDLGDLIVIGAEAILRDRVAPTVAQILDISVVGVGPADSNTFVIALILRTRSASDAGSVL